MTDKQAYHILKDKKEGADKNGKPFKILHVGEITTVVQLHNGEKNWVKNVVLQNFV